MGIWSKLFGGNKGDGAPRDDETPAPENETVEDRKIVEERDTIHPNWVRTRGTLVAGVLEGVWEEFGIPKYGANTGELGPLMKRCFYKQGVLDGRYETWSYYGQQLVEGQYENGARVGRWVYLRHDKTIASEAVFEQGRVVTWRWLARDGRERPVVTLGDDVQEVIQWNTLGDAWDTRATEGTYVIELAVDAWPAEQHARPLAWLDERIASEGRPKTWAAGPQWLALMSDQDEIDPRTKYVDAINVDHHDWDREQTRRLQRFAPQIVEIGLVECDVQPNLAALFDVPWPALARLWLDECGELDEIVPTLASLPLVDLALTSERVSDTALARLLAMPWLANLERLSLFLASREQLGTLAAAAMPALRTLEIELDMIEPLSVADLVAFTDRERRPALEKLSLRGVQIDGELPSTPGLEVDVDTY